MTDDPTGIADQTIKGIAVPLPAEPAERRKRPVVGIIASMLIFGSMLALAWQNYDWLTQVIYARAHTESTTNAVSYADLEGFRQSTAASLQTIIDSLTTQQADTKRLSDQFADMSSRLATISSRLDASADPVAGWPKAAAQPSPSFALVPPPATARKKLAPVPKPVRAISVGGAPLPLVPAR